MIKNYLLLFCFLIMLSCNTEPSIVNTQIETNGGSVTETKLDQTVNLNISILIDLSDRIDTAKNPNATMQYFHRDTGYIASVVNAYKSHVLSKKLILINDRIQTFIDPTPQNSKIVSTLEKLKVDLDKNNVNKETLLNLSTVYAENTVSLYQQALKDKKYIGSDTWRFFKSSVKDYCIKPNTQNVLVILTDGYMFHENSKIIEENRSNQIYKRTFSQLGLNSSAWQENMKKKDFGFPPATDDLSNLKVMVLGLNPYSKNPFEEDVLKAYWGKWFTEMGVKDFLIKRADLPINLDESIQNFILTP